MQNFSVLPTLIVPIICLSIIIVSATLPQCFRAFRQRRLAKGNILSTKAQAAQVARLADSRYQLLAIALADAGIGPWEHSKTEIPVLKDKLAIIDGIEASIQPNGLARYLRPSAKIEEKPGDEPKPNCSEKATEANQHTTKNLPVISSPPSIASSADTVTGDLQT